MPAVRGGGGGRFVIAGELLPRPERAVLVAQRRSKFGAPGGRLFEEKRCALFEAGVTQRARPGVRHVAEVLTALAADDEPVDPC